MSCLWNSPQKLQNEQQIFEYVNQQNTIIYQYLMKNQRASLCLPRPPGGVGGKHRTPLFPEAFALAQRGPDMSDSERQDQWSHSEHTLLPQEFNRHRNGLTAGAQQAGRPGAEAQEVGHVGDTDHVWCVIFDISVSWKYIWFSVKYGFFSVVLVRCC